MKDTDTDWVAMQVPDGTDWLEYMLNVSPTADKQTLGVMNHVSLGVKDIKVAEASLHASRAKMRADDSPKIGRDGKWQYNLLYDPDDTRVELMELLWLRNPAAPRFLALTLNHDRFVAPSHLTFSLCASSHCGAVPHGEAFFRQGVGASAPTSDL